MRIDRKAVLSAAVVAALSYSSVTLAADRFWDGTAGNNNWSHGPNWFGGVPSAADDAKFDTAGSVVRNVVVIDALSLALNMFIDGVPPPGNYEFQSLGNAQLFVGNDLTIAGIAANPTPVTFNNLNVDAGRMVLGAHGTLNLTGLSNKLHAANGMQIFGRLNWQGGTVTQSPFSTITINSGGSMDVTGGRGLGPDATIAITDGQFTSDSYFDIGSSLDAGNGPVGTLSVSGSSASYVQTGGAIPIWGYQGGDQATVTFTDAANGTLASGVDIGTNGGSAFVQVLAGAKLHVGDHMNVGVVSMRRSSSGRLNATNSAQQPNGSLSNIPAVVAIDGGTLTVGGTAHVGGGGLVHLKNGKLELNGDATFSSGSMLNWSGGTMSIASGKTLTFDGEFAAASVTANGRGLSDGATLRVINGAEFDSTNYLDIGATDDPANGPTGTLLVSGPGSRFSTAHPSFDSSLWGHKTGDSATVTFSSSSVGTLSNGVHLATAGGRALVTISDGATLHVANRLFAGSASGAATINITGGTLVNTGTAGLHQGAVVNYSAGTLNAGTLGMFGNAKVLLTSGGNKVMRSIGLSMSGTSKIDLSDNDMFIDYVGAAPIAGIRGYLLTGRNGGNWLGNGLTSSAAAAVNPRTTALGYNDINNGGGGAVFIKYTWCGDTDLNGVVNFDDYNRTDGGFNNGGTTWFEGDFDYNGQVNFDDYALIDLAFNSQSGTLRQAMSFLESGGGIGTDGMDAPALHMVGQHFAQFGQPYATAFLNAVPEPTYAIAALGSCIGLRVRRRRD